MTLRQMDLLSWGLRALAVILFAAGVLMILHDLVW